jgi:hypothetical protein
MTFTLVNADFSTDEDGGKVVVISLVTEVESTEEAAALIDSIGREFTLTPQ